MHNIYCIIITYNIGKKIEETYNSIRSQVNNIIFVDNYSDEETINILKKILNKNSTCKVIFNQKNEGIAKALNIGIKEAILEGADFILTLDHDSDAKKNMVINMINVYDNLKSKYNIGMINPIIYDINKKDYLTKINDELYQFVKQPIQSGSLIPIEAFNKMGFFNEQMFIYYVDTEFSYRLLNKGYNLIQCNKAILYHEEGKKALHKILTKKFYYNNYNEFAVYYKAKNYIYMKRNYRSKFHDKYRLSKDFFKILMFDKAPTKKIIAHFKGIYDGMFKI